MELENHTTRKKDPFLSKDNIELVYRYVRKGIYQNTGFDIKTNYVKEIIEIMESVREATPKPSGVSISNEKYLLHLNRLSVSKSIQLFISDLKRQRQQSQTQKKKKVRFQDQGTEGDEEVWDQTHTKVQVGENTLSILPSLPGMENISVSNFEEGPSNPTFNNSYLLPPRSDFSEDIRKFNVTSTKDDPVDWTTVMSNMERLRTEFEQKRPQQPDFENMEPQFLNGMRENIAAKDKDFLKSISTQPNKPIPKESKESISEPQRQQQQQLQLPGYDSDETFSVPSVREERNEALDLLETKTKIKIAKVFFDSRKPLESEMFKNVVSVEILSVELRVSESLESYVLLFVPGFNRKGIAKIILDQSPVKFYTGNKDILIFDGPILSVTHETLNNVYFETGAGERYVVEHFSVTYLLTSS